MKPEISGSPTTWGVKLNADLDLIDNTVFSNDAAQTAAIAAAIAANILIGEIKMFAGLSPPADWLRCDGTVYPNTDIPLLAPILNNAFGGVPGVSNAVPECEEVSRWELIALSPWVRPAARIGTPLPSMKFRRTGMTSL